MPKVAEHKLRNGLRVQVVRKPTVPKIEAQLLVELPRSLSAAPELLLAKTITSGTRSHSSVEIARELQGLGASLAAAAGADHFGLSGSVLAPNLGRYLGLVAEVLTDAVFPAGEVAVERARALQEIQIRRSQPQFIAVEALRKRLFGRHPYGVVQPEPEVLQKVGRAKLQRLFEEGVQPRGATLVLVGDVQPQSAINAVEKALASWKGKKTVARTPEPKPIKLGPTVIFDRPEAVQTNIRIAGPALPPGHPGSYALEVANAIFGGAFMGRFIQNLREDKGYTYSPHSGFTHLLRTSTFEIAADVGTEVTAPSLVETRYELGKLASLEVDKEELEAVQRYLTGIMSIRIQSQRGLAATLARLTVFGLDISYLKEYPARINAVTTADVRDACMRYLAPSKLVTVLVGDASRIRADVEALEHVTLQA
jgi:predicted Zn-dependent peptidase